MLVKSEAIILKSMKYGETSKIVTLYSKAYGKLKGITKGARTAKNKFGSALEPLTRSMVLMYKKEHRDLHLISQCDVIESHKNLSEDLDCLTTALAIIELVHHVSHDEESNPVLFDLLSDILRALNSRPKNYSSYFHAFRLRLASIFGYEPNFENCGNCGARVPVGEDEKEFAFQIARGAVFCPRCKRPVDSFSNMDPNIPFISLSAGALQSMRRLIHEPIPGLSTLEIDAHTGNQIDELLRLYLRFHLEGFRPLKSMELLIQNKAVS